MCGGTLGICVALALQQQGLRVAVVEKRRVEGRLQEWNSSRHEIQVGGLYQPVHHHGCRRS
jgi:lycopene cyclase CruP